MAEEQIDYTAILDLQIDPELVYTAMETMRVDLRTMDQLDPNYITGKIVECRNHISAITDHYRLVTRERTRIENLEANIEMRYEILKDSRLASTEADCNRGSSIEDRKAIINTELVGLRTSLRMAKSRVKEVANLEKVITVVMRNLENVSKDIEKQRKVMEMQVRELNFALKGDKALHDLNKAMAEISEAEVTLLEDSTAVEVDDDVIEVLDIEIATDLEEEEVLAQYEGFDTEEDVVQEHAIDAVPVSEVAPPLGVEPIEQITPIVADDSEDTTSADNLVGEDDFLSLMMDDELDIGLEDCESLDDDSTYTPPEKASTPAEQGVETPSATVEIIPEQEIVLPTIDISVVAVEEDTDQELGLPDLDFDDLDFSLALESTAVELPELSRQSENEQALSETSLDLSVLTEIGSHSEENTPALGDVAEISEVVEDDIPSEYREDGEALGEADLPEIEIEIDFSEFDTAEVVEEIRPPKKESEPIQYNMPPEKKAEVKTLSKPKPVLDEIDLDSLLDSIDFG